MIKRQNKKALSFGLLWRTALFRPRLSISVLIGIASYFLIPPSLSSRMATHTIIAWNIGAIVYLLLTLEMMINSTAEKMVDRARQQDEGKLLILFFVIASVVICFTSVTMELTSVKNALGINKILHIALVSSTILTSWFFTHVMFGLHYAHDYYDRIQQKIDPGLSFPGQELPDYFDFLYFSFIIGTSGQTADVSFTCSKLRRVGTVHCILAYLFNTTVLALTINIASGLL